MILSMPYDYRCRSLFLSVTHEILYKYVMVELNGSITMVTVRPHEACRAMKNSRPECRNLQCERNNHYGFFFGVLFIGQQHLKLNFM